MSIHDSKTLLLSLDHFREVVIQYDKLLNVNIGLEEKLKEAEAMYKDFMSVSIIVNTKNENDQLRNELSLLRKKLIYLEKENLYNKRIILSYKNDRKGKSLKNENDNDEQYAANVEEVVELSDENENDDDEIELIEYKYDGKTYFITNDDDKVIYDRIKIDGEYEPSDEEIGYLKSHGDSNTIPVWY
jgi:hypothetical protein